MAEIVKCNWVEVGPQENRRSGDTLVFLETEDIVRMRAALSLDGDLISRSALLDELGRKLSIVDMVSVAEIVNAVDAVEAEPVVHAHWEQYVDEDEDWGDLPYFKCSACGTDELTGHKRCPECGAHMDEEVSDAQEV